MTGQAPLVATRRCSLRHTDTTFERKVYTQEGALATHDGSLKEWVSVSTRLFSPITLECIGERVNVVTNEYDHGDTHGWRRQPDPGSDGPATAHQLDGGGIVGV